MFGNDGRGRLPVAQRRDGGRWLRGRGGKVSGTQLMTSPLPISDPEYSRASGPRRARLTFGPHRKGGLARGVALRICWPSDTKQWMPTVDVAVLDRQLSRSLDCFFAQPMRKKLQGLAMLRPQP